MIYVSNDQSERYGENGHIVDEIYPLSDVLLEILQGKYAFLVVSDMPDDNIWGCPSALVIDSDGRAEGDPDTPVVVVRPKGEAEILVDNKEPALRGLDATTQEFIKIVADTDRQNSLSLMYNNMSTTDKGRAKVYFDWHKSMLAKHYALKAAIAGAADTATLVAILGNTERICEWQYAELMAAAPYDAVDLSSYIH